MTAPIRVFAAASTLTGAAAFWLSAAIATFFAIPQYSRYYGDLEQDPDTATLTAFLLAAVAFAAIVGAGLAVLLALLDGGGRPAARVLTMILGAVAACVAVGVIVGDPFAAIGWHRRLMTATATLTLLLVIATVVMLASSGAYFREAASARAAHLAAVRRARFAAYPVPPTYPPPPPTYPPQQPPPQQPPPGEPD